MLGVTTQAIADGASGFVTVQGLVRGLNTSAWPVGTILYADPTTAGNFTATEPEAPSLKLPVAAVLKSGPGTSGILYVRMHVGEMLGGLHDVQITDLANGEILQYNSTTERWENVAIDALPDQTSHAGEYLTTDGSTASWTAIETGGDPKPDVFLLMGA